MLTDTEERLLSSYFIHGLVELMQLQKKDMKMNIYILLIIKIASAERQKRKLSTYIIKTILTYNADL